jgi:hypothetical protein
MGLKIHMGISIESYPKDQARLNSWGKGNLNVFKQLVTFPIE